MQTTTLNTVRVGGPDARLPRAGIGAAGAAAARLADLLVPVARRDAGDRARPTASSRSTCPASAARTSRPARATTSSSSSRRSTASWPRSTSTRSASPATTSAARSRCTGRSRRPERVTQARAAEHARLSRVLGRGVRVRQGGEHARRCASRLTSPEGLEEAMRLGVADEANVTDEVLAGVTEPFADRRGAPLAGRRGDRARARRASPRSRAATRRRCEVPVRIVYGAQDRILPDVAETMARGSRRTCRRPRSPRCRRAATSSRRRRRRRSASCWRAS